MKWNVYYHNPNSDSINIINVFDHAGFRKDVVEALGKCREKTDFEDVVRKSHMYHFWSKCEWEVLVTAWSGGDAETKIDVYDQIWNNREIFIDYLWRFRDA